MDGSWTRGGDMESEAANVQAETTEFGSSRFRKREAADGDVDGVKII